MYFVKSPYLLQTFFNSFIWKIPTNEKKIFLTFDDGPHPEITPDVLDILNRYNAKASFFCVGKNIEKHPNIFDQIVANGHTIGNHTYNHINGYKTNTSLYVKNTFKNNDIYTTSLFRPPYGRMKRRQISILKKDFCLILWTVLSGDFDKSITKEKCLKNVINSSKEGSIVVFHDSLKAKENVLYALPKVLEYFSNKGYGFFAINREICKKK